MCLCHCGRNVADMFFDVSASATGDDMWQREDTQECRAVTQIFEESESAVLTKPPAAYLELIFSRPFPRCDHSSKHSRPMCLCLPMAEAKLNKFHFHIIFV